MSNASPMTRASCASALLKAMANPYRLLILYHLAGGEKRVGELERAIGLSQSALSQHLARLRRENLVTTRRSSQLIFYSLASVEVSSVLAVLSRLYRIDGNLPLNGVDEHAGASSLTAP